MFGQFRAAAAMLTTLTLFTGVLYPVLVTGLAQALFPWKANGSLIDCNGKPIGSELIGQQFTGPRFFWGRLSATRRVPYNAEASGGSNLGPLHPNLVEATKARTQALREGGPLPATIPVDLATASGSGLDPHCSPAAANVQVPRVAAARGMSEDRVRELVRRYTEGRQFGVLGEPRVHVLALNLALDRDQDER